MKKLNYFRKAQVRITIQYFLINFVIIVISSVMAIFIVRHLLLQTLDPSQLGTGHSIIRENIKEAHDIFISRVLIFDVVLVLISAIAGFFLSGRALRSIKEMMRRQEEFAADASHELRTPLAAINMEIEATKRTEEKIPPVYSELLDSIQEELKHMTNTVSGLLMLVRSDSGDEVERGPLDLADVARQAVKKIEAGADSSNISLSTRALERAPVLGNEDQIKQSILVLLDNAIRYTPAGGSVTVSTGSTGSRSSFTVADTGVGIARKDQTRIFDRFYRAYDKRIDDQQRTGLGLSIARKIVENHGGTISVASVPGEGSVFTIDLPRHRS